MYSPIYFFDAAGSRKIERMDVFIVGCGYTGSRVAQRFLARGAKVSVTTRNPDKLSLPGAEILKYEAGDERPLPVPRAALVLHSLPSVAGEDPTPALLRALGEAPARMVYFSTTGVYGAAKQVDENTPVQARGVREAARLQAESAVRAGNWSSIVLRPAAIYGPGRGAHEAMRRGEFYLVGEGSNFVSRIHVDDLAAHAEAALLSDVEGAWPVADEEPCTSRQMAEFCSQLLGVPMPPSVPYDQAHHTRQADRRVDGSAIRQRLGLTLRYPSYRLGIPASV